MGGGGKEGIIKVGGRARRASLRWGGQGGHLQGRGQGKEGIIKVGGRARRASSRWGGRPRRASSR